MGSTTTIAQFIASTDYSDVPPKVIETAKSHLRDTIGVALAGSSIDLGDIAAQHVEVNNAGDAATVIGHGTASYEGAAFANGVASHALEWDDTPGGPHHLTHPSPPTVPAVLAAAEHAGATGREVMAGYVIGVEVLSRLELASFPGHYFHGWHDTSTYGVFGAMAAAASILNLDTETIEHALGIAASCSAGLRKNNGTMTKPFHAGHVAADGLRAVTLADSGMTSDPEIIEGRLGYLNVYSPDTYDDSPLDTFGEEWHFCDYGYKPFPAITFNHGAQIALQRLVIREDLTPDDVERITVSLKERAWDTLWNEDPDDPFEAIASPEFNLAVILRERTHGIEQFNTDYVTASETKRQMQKVEREILEDDDFDLFGARIAVETVDGTEYIVDEHYSPLDVSEDRLDEKFKLCAERALSQSEAERVDDAISDIEDEGRLDALLNIL